MATEALKAFAPVITNLFFRHLTANLKVYSNRY